MRCVYVLDVCNLFVQYPVWTRIYEITEKGKKSLVNLFHRKIMRVANHKYYRNKLGTRVVFKPN